jgi:hypothetical protein
MRDVEVTLTAARFASIAVCAPDLVNVDGMNPLDTLPYQQDRSDVLRLLIARGVRVKDDYKDPPVRDEDGKPMAPMFTIPSTADYLAEYYGGQCRLPGLQRSLALQQEKKLRQECLATADATDIKRVRSCSANFAGSFLHHDPHETLSEEEFAVAFRNRIGVDPLPNLRALGCPFCKKEATPLHALSCKLHCGTLTTLRHHKACKLLAQFARSTGCLASCTDKTDFGGRGSRGQKVPDGVIHTSSSSYLFDAHGVHTLAPSAAHREPEAVIRSRERWKTNKYREQAFLEGCEFIPLVMDTFGKLGQQAEMLCEKLAAEELAFGSHSPEYIAIPLSTFRMELACLWQKYTSRAIIQFAKLCRAEVYKPFVHYCNVQCNLVYYQSIVEYIHVFNSLKLFHLENQQQQQQQQPQMKNKETIKGNIN